MRPTTSSRRAARAAATVAVTALAVAYLVWKIDVGRTLDLLASADVPAFLGSLAIMLATVAPFAWRWQRLLAARGVRERLPWLARAYLVSYTAGQVLPTSLGGDAARIYETVRRHPGAGEAAAGSVLLERALGGTATLVLAAAGFALALGGGFDVGAYLWVEAALVAAAVAAALAVFSRPARRPLRRLAPLLARARLERPLRAAYEGLHAYRRDPGLLAGAFALTLAVQAVRVLAIWLAGEAVGVELSPRPYYVMGPLLFLVMLVPFTVNGLAVRESFFVSFLGTLGVGSDAAFATGFLFFVVTLGLSLPGAAILAWEGLRGAGRPSPRST